MSNVQGKNERHSSRGKYNEPQIVEEGMHCSTYYDVICVKQKSAPNIQYKDKEVRFLGA